MATYSKLPFCEENYLLGYQTVNQARDNLDSVYDALKVEHSTGVASALPVGRHDTQKISRVVIQVYGTGSANTSAWGASPALQITSQYGIQSATRISTGVYLVPISFLSSYWARADPNCTQSSTPILVCRSETPTGTITLPGRTTITVSCYEMSSGSMVLTDMDFTLTVYGY